jgi:hypothetical protein
MYKTWLGRSANLWFCFHNFVFPRGRDAASEAPLERKYSRCGQLILDKVDFKEENEIENARLVTDHFGYWPSFHDSEILSLRFHRDLDKSVDSMEMRVYAFEMTDKVVLGCFF